MAKPLDFNKVKKTYLTITLNDEDKTTIMIGTPTKQVYDDLTAISKSIAEISEEDTNQEVLDDLYDQCAKLMSRNKTNKKITKEHLEKVFDFEDIMIFFDAYTAFINEVTSQKN